MWNDIVNANCARASTTASQSSNIGTIHRRYSGGELTTPGLAMVSDGGPIPPATPQKQSDPEGGHPVRVVGGDWRLELVQRLLVPLSSEITQTSVALLVLQSTTCWR